MSLFNILTERGKPKTDAAKDKKGAVKAKKGRVRIFATIAKALEQGHVGQIFSTKGSDRLYVVSNAGWGEKSKGKIAKGFTPGSSTPSSEWSSIKAHSMRTSLKHGHTKSGRLMKKYGPGAEDKIDNSKKAAGKK